MAGPLKRMLRGVVDAGDAVLRAEDKVRHPFASRRWSSLSSRGTAVVTGVASLPGNETDLPAETVRPQSVLFRLDVRREDGSSFTCGLIQQAASGITRQVEPGLVLDVRCHPTEPSAAADWEATAARLARRLDWDRRNMPISWADEDEWPPEGVVQVRFRPADQKRLDERRTTWRYVEVKLQALGPGQETFDQGRRQFTVAVELDGRRLDLLEAVPDLALARMIAAPTAPAPPAQPVTRRIQISVEISSPGIDVRVGLPLVALTDGASACIDWEATLAQPEFHGLEGIPAG